MLKIGDKGAAVRALQEDLNVLGAGLKLDGDLGPKTLAAANNALRLDKYHDADPTVLDDDELGFIAALRRLVEQPAAPPPLPPFPDLLAEAKAFDPLKFQASMIDLRKQHLPYYRKADGSHQTYSPLPRPISEVTGICDHQTACDMGEREARYYTIGSHFVVLRSGRVLWMCDVDRVVYHGNGWNARTVGIEVNGLYSGLEDDPDTAQDESLRTTWDDKTTPTRETPMVVTPQSLRGLRDLHRWICWHVRQRGGQVKFLVAHRQSSLDRQNDPGQTLWQQGAVPMHAELGLSDGGVGFKIGGYAIPEQWDPRCVGVKY